MLTHQNLLRSIITTVLDCLVDCILAGAQLRLDEVGVAPAYDLDNLVVSGAAFEDSQIAVWPIVVLSSHNAAHF